MLVEHVEKYLGKIESGYKLSDRQFDVSVSKFRDQPFEGIITYSTIGLSKYELFNNGKKYELELLLSVNESFNDQDISSFLLSFSEHLLKHRKALLRGEIVGPHDKLISETEMNGIYCSIPVFFEDDFVTFESKVFVWLIPLYENELRFIEENGWDKFETVLEDNPDIDFWDLKRDEIFT